MHYHKKITSKGGGGVSESAEIHNQTIDYLEREGLYSTLEYMCLLSRASPYFFCYVSASLRVLDLRAQWKQKFILFFFQCLLVGSGSTPQSPSDEQTGLPRPAGHSLKTPKQTPVSGHTRDHKDLSQLKVLRQFKIIRYSYLNSFTTEDRN